MSKSLADLILGFLIIGGVTAVIAVVALVLAKREDREVRREPVAPSAEPVRWAS
jgi:hypothetical protein